LPERGIDAWLACHERDGAARARHLASMDLAAPGIERCLTKSHAAEHLGRLITTQLQSQSRLPNRAIQQLA